LTERVAVLFTFPKHSPAAPWQRSLQDLLEVSLHKSMDAGAALACFLTWPFGILLIVVVGYTLQKYPVCCGRLAFAGKDGYIACNSAGNKLPEKTSVLGAMASLACLLCAPE